jgi:hypothetical protein
MSLGQRGCRNLIMALVPLAKNGGFDPLSSPFHPEVGNCPLTSSVLAILNA